MKNKKIIVAVSLILCLAFVIAGCSSSFLMGAAPPKTDSNESADMNRTSPQFGKADGGEGYAYDSDTRGIVSGEKAIAPEPPASGGLYPENQKLIFRLSYSVETLEFDKSISAINELTKSLGGFVEGTSISGGPRILTKSDLENGKNVYKDPRHGTFNLRIPADKLSEFESKAGDIGNVIDSSKSSQDITLQYTDNEARLNSLKVQEERLLDMLKKSGNLSDLIQIENALSNVRYQIESYTSMQRQFDSSVTYSFVTLNLREVIEYTEQIENPKTLWQRISTEFKQSVKGIANTAENLIVWFLGNILSIIINLAILAAIAYFALKIYKKYKKKYEL